MPRGGVRMGAGRKKASSVPYLKRAVTLSPEDIAFLTALGAGNLSAGIRRAVADARSVHAGERERIAT